MSLPTRVIKVKILIISNIGMHFKQMELLQMTDEKEKLYNQFGKLFVSYKVKHTSRLLILK